MRVLSGPSVFPSRELRGHVGLDSEYGRAAFAVCISFLLMLLYFDCDASRAFIHALRRHWLTSIANIQLHWPLSAGLILMSAALPTMVSERTSEMGFRWYFGQSKQFQSGRDADSVFDSAGGTAVALLCTALIGWMHLSLDAPHTSILPRVGLQASLAEALLTRLVSFSGSVSSPASSSPSSSPACRFSCRRAT